jgi:hypothetical protein
VRELFKRSVIFKKEIAVIRKKRKREKRKGGNNIINKARYNSINIIIMMKKS